MHSVERSTVVDAPVAAAYEHWKRVEDWPKFLKAIREVRRIDDTCFSWKSQRGGIDVESMAKITLLIPERRIAWRTVSGPQNSGLLVFEEMPGNNTRVSFQMRYEPDAGWQNQEALAARLEFHLACFKEYIEKQNSESMAKSSPRTITADAQDRPVERRGRMLVGEHTR